MRRADRLFQIMLLLGRGKVTTARSLADELEVSERTVYRDMADLMACGVPIDGEAGVGYLLRKGYNLPPMMFSQEELEALAVGMRMVESRSDPAFARAARSALAKIEAVLPAGLKHGAAAPHLLVPDFHIPEKFTAPMGRLREAIGGHRKIRLHYRKPDGEASRRVIWPLGLVYWGPTWTLAAWCEARSDFRTFRLDRMETVDLLDEPFDAQRGRLLAAYLEKARGG